MRSQSSLCKCLFLCVCTIVSYVAQAQKDPVAYLSRNSVISVLQDRLMKSYVDLVLKNYIYCAPSYCYVNDTLLNFTEVISSKDINHERIFLTTYCDDINSLKLQILSSGEKSFIIVKGKVTVENKGLTVQLTDGLGSNVQLNSVAAQFISNQVVDRIALDQLAITYEQKLFDKFDLAMKFTTDGFLVGVKSPELSVIDSKNLSAINRELQSTGVTSIAVFLPVDFVNKQLENTSIPYNDHNGTDITLKNNLFYSQSNDLFFQTSLSGSSLRNTPLHNTYKITAAFNSLDMTLKTLRSSILTGTDAQEAREVRTIINYFENQFRDKLVFTLPNEHDYNVKSGNSQFKLNVKTYYGHYINGVIAFVNSFNIKK